jgi:hypothetical protein
MICQSPAMFKKTLLVGFVIFVNDVGLLHAQAPEAGEGKKEPEKTKVSDTSTPDAFWTANVPGGQYMVALSRITSVSRHKYLLDAAVLVDEVTVDTDGQALARFYTITPVPTPKTPVSFAKEAADRSKEIAEKLIDRSGVKLQDMVMKKYPETSHAKSLEYRIMSDAELTSLYNSVENAWFYGKGRKFTIADVQPAK